MAKRRSVWVVELKMGENWYVPVHLFRVKQMAREWVAEQRKTSGNPASWYRFVRYDASK